LKVVFAGTPAFAAVALAALLDAGHEVPVVLTQPDRPAGRGLEPRASATKVAALARGLTVCQAPRLDAAAIETVRTARPDALVVAAYGLLLPPALLELPARGCLNVHASLLPRWRGAAPIQRAILAGDRETGVTIMQMDAGLDTGAILLQESLPISPADTAGSLHDRLAIVGARLIVRALATPVIGQPQDESRATYARRIGKHEAEIAWERPAEEIARQVRAFNPAPGAHTYLDGQVLKIWCAQAESGTSGPAGTVHSIAASGVLVACGRGGLRVTELQRAGGRRLGAKAFLAGAALPAGVRLGKTDG
jgi:methionyl-tRNA formyltransferase